MEIWLAVAVNGISYGLLLFLLSAGLTLIFSMMGVLNFAHASFYMLGAYLAYTVSGHLGFWASFLLVPVACAVLGAAFEVACLRPVRRAGHLPELLMTFGLSFLLFELVQLGWGRAPVDYRLPALLQGPLFTVQGFPFPRHRAFMVLLSLLMLLFMWLVLRRSRIGLVVAAAITHADMVQALGHNVPRIMTGVFAAGSALTGLAGVIGGAVWVTEPGMAAALGPIIFVVVVIGGLGSLQGAFWASMLIGCLQTWAVGVDISAASVLAAMGLAPAVPAWVQPVVALQLSDMAPVLPFLLLTLVLIFRPRGLMGRRDA
jgi:branched-chain amino acid transport system permease protein